MNVVFNVIAKSIYGDVIVLERTIVVIVDNYLLLNDNNSKVKN